MLGSLFLQVASRLQQQRGDCVFIIPAANDQRKQQIQDQLQTFGGGIDVQLLDGQSHQVMAAADAILLASGTTALEAMLFKKPMVVAYKIAPLSFAIISRLVKAKYVSLPNLLADKAIVPELLQHDATVEALSEQMHDILAEAGQRQVQQFYTLHKQLQQDASQTAARAVLELING